MTGPVLVVAHEATRTGSPRVLLELARRFLPTLDAPVAVRLLADGPLAEDLRALGSTSPVGFRPAVALLNSAPSAAVALELDDDVAVLAYVHEEGDALRVLPEAAVRGLVERCDRVLCVSEAGRADLAAMGVAPERLDVLPPSVVVSDTAREAEDLDAVRDRIGAVPGAPLVVACGEASWRKGADLFVDVARRSTAGAVWAWVGRRPRAFGRLLDHDVRTAGLEGRVRWVGEVADARPLLAAADLVVMPSREDPQPLVPLEAAVVGTATAAFAIGGLGALADDGAAAVVPFPDTVALAALVDALLADDDRRAHLAAAAQDRVRARHDVDRAAERLGAELRGLRRASGHDGAPARPAEEPPQ